MLFSRLQRVAFLCVLFASPALALKLTAASRAVLKGETRVEMRRAVAGPRKAAGSPAPQSGSRSRRSCSRRSWRASLGRG